MRCKQCIFQEAPSTSSLGNDGDVPVEICQKCSVDENGKVVKKAFFNIDLITTPIQRLIMECFPVKIEWSEVFGRYLVATRDIHQGELIFQIEPIISGPTPSYTEAEWLCMSCYKATKKKTMLRCPDCQWPFCSSECAEDEVHDEYECLVLAKAKVLPEENYQENITLMQLLRCLLLKTKDPTGWQQMMSMESHIEGRKNSSSDVWERWRKEEIKFIRETLGLKEFDEEEINFVSGVLSMNAFGSNDIHGPKHRHGSYLYYLGAMASHDCSPNADYEVDANQDFNLKASVDISKGSQITLSYALPFQGTLLRREYLKDYFFDCCCARCSDSTEFGSYFSALKCSSCENGHLLPEYSLLEESPWKCSEAVCQGQKQVSEVSAIIKGFETLRESPPYVIDSKNCLVDIENLEELMEKGKPLFHPNHFCLMGVEFELINKLQYYLEIKQIPMSWNDRLLELTRKHIEIGQMVWNGWNDRYGRLLFMLQAGLLNSLSSKCQKDSSETDTQRVIKEIMRVRNEAKNILLSKPSGSYEHQLGLKLKLIMDKEATEADLIERLKKL
ncbi:Protein msta, isoform A [Orchesella cincta]|uniref:Protein msta, isoform A n=1 Tax=Orchesella cincta TaxID=48709 RepID=A0A1D2NA35_ORCCI|nr:Protein msta, isoform A [Orchesella cincta]